MNLGINLDIFTNYPQDIAQRKPTYTQRCKRVYRLSVKIEGTHEKISLSEKGAKHVGAQCKAFILERIMVK